MAVTPGPDRIEPGSAPGGIVFHVYDRTGILLVDQRPTTLLAAAAMAEAAAARFLIGDMCLVLYDGDTGNRLPGEFVAWLVTDPDRRIARPEMPPPQPDLNLIGHLEQSKDFRLDSWRRPSPTRTGDDVS